MLRRARALDMVASVALILAATAVIVSSSLDVYARFHRPATPAVRPAAAFRPGMKAPVVSGVEYATSDRTLVLFLSTKCMYCEMSVPFYRDLAERVKDAGAKRRLVAVFPQNDDEVKEFRNRQKLEFETLAGVPLGEAGIASTPTMLLVSRDGTVVQSWIGAPGKQAKEAITQAFIRS